MYDLMNKFTIISKTHLRFYHSKHRIIHKKNTQNRFVHYAQTHYFA